MPFITNENDDVDIYFQDRGEGRPVILIHGWPLSHRAWEPQVSQIVDAGYRCITYDRRGFGVSSSPESGMYDYSSLASDLRTLIMLLDLEEVTIVGFSMGGGEVVRYLTAYGDDNIAQAALISSIIPLVAQKDDNPSGVPQDDLDGILDAVKNDRIGFLGEFHKNFYNFNDEDDDGVTQRHLDYDFTIASHASALGTVECAVAWATTDFRPELKNVSVPTLIVHGNADNIVPKETAGDQAAARIENNTYHVIEDAPHGLNLTHRDTLNKILINFLNEVKS